MNDGLNYKLLIDRLRNLPDETEWSEFKVNNRDPKMIAADLSALANSAARLGVPHGYMAWGIDNDSHDVAGTNFNPRRFKIGNEEIENWLHHSLSTNASFRFIEVPYDEARKVVLLQIEPARGNTVDFNRVAYTRVGTYTKRLKDYPAIETETWRKISQSAFERDAAKEGLSIDEALGLLDYPKYFDLLAAPLPQSHKEIARSLKEDGIIRSQEDGLFTITNLGALLLAKDLASFPTVARKALRIIQYRGRRKSQMRREWQMTSGYAVDFESAITVIMAITPSDEPIVGGIRRKETQYPEIAVREIVANALIHQDLRITGSGPLVEIFDGRIDISNPGASLVDTLRLVDNPPKSRNQEMASLMRRFHICEEAGSGWDKTIDACEEYALPTPSVINYTSNEGSMKVSLYPYEPYASMSSEARVMACYWHACMCLIEDSPMGNSSLRARFGKDAPSSSTISRLIREALDRELIKPVDPAASQRYMRYVPFWA